jgi:hypothetical protein
MTYYLSYFIFECQELFPAKRTARFDQGIIEAITKMAGGSLMPDLDEEYGKNFHVQSNQAARR